MYDISALRDRNRVLEDASIPRLVSYPRTGSHWLRMILEICVGMPCYVRSFFDPHPTSCWGIHIHNRIVNSPGPTEGKVRNLDKVIYLYRDPTSTIYSNLKYENVICETWDGYRSPEITSRVNQLVLEYKNHLSRWMLDNKDIKEFTCLSYENLKQDPEDCVAGICKFLGVRVDNKKMLEAVEICSKSLTKKLTPHDGQALNSEYFAADTKYIDNRSRFAEIYGDEISSAFKISSHPGLQEGELYKIVESLNGVVGQ